MLSFKSFLNEKRGLWDNIHAKQERIKNGSGERMRKPGSKGAPSAQDFKDAQATSEAKVCPECGKDPCECEKLEEAAVDSKGYKSSTGGLTQKGRDHYNRETGGNLQAPVTKKPSTLKKGSKAYNRRKSFCARMSGVEGPMEKDGKPTRKALALRKWNC